MSMQVQNLSQMRELRLSAMTQAYELQTEQPKLHQLDFDKRFGLLLEAEVSARKSRKVNRLVKVAALPELAGMEDIDYRASRGLDKPLIASLASCAWIRRHHNLMILGATGLGKSWLACAFAHQACRLDMSVAFHRTTELYERIAEAHIDATLPKLKATLIKSDLLVLDDFGIGEMPPSAAQVLLDVVDRRTKTGSLLITSQYPLEKWHDCFPDPTIADAVLDRIVHQAYKIQLKGESMRKSRGKAALAAAD